MSLDPNQLKELLDLHKKAQELSNVDWTKQVESAMEQINKWAKYSSALMHSSNGVLTSLKMNEKAFKSHSSVPEDLDFEIEELPNEFIVKAALPGLQKPLNVRLQGVTLSITGTILDKKAKGQSRDFNRSIKLPNLVQPKGSASYKNDNLLIRLPKLESPIHDIKVNF